MTKPTPGEFATAAKVLRHLEEVEGVDPDDLGMVGHLAWVCETYAAPRPAISTPHSQALWILSGKGVPPTEAEDYADAERDIRRIR